MLSHGAELIVTAEDAFNPSVDPEFPQSVFPLPGPGMFTAMFRALMFPRGANKLRVCGKGGAVGDDFMVGHALAMLREHHSWWYTGRNARLNWDGARSSSIGALEAKLALFPHFTAQPQ